MSKKYFGRISSLITLACLLTIIIIALLGCDTRQGAGVANIGEGGMWVDMWDKGYLYVEIVPTSRAEAGVEYTVDLYESGNLRAQYEVSWTQPELNVQTPKETKFPINQNEYDAYYEAEIPKTWDDLDEVNYRGYMDGWWEGVFSVKVHE